MNNNNQNVVRLPGAADVGTIAIRAASNFARRNKVITTSYLFGLLILIIGGTGSKLTWDQRRQYERIMNSIDLEAENNAYNQYYYSKSAYDRSKGWFTCDAVCTRYKNKMQKDKAILDGIRREGHNRMSDAKATAGIFSEIGVGEVKVSPILFFYFQKMIYT